MHALNMHIGHEDNRVAAYNLIMKSAQSQTDQ